jgi:signal transduction histidine kinase/CheY-like chemotaxis protein
MTATPRKPGPEELRHQAEQALAQRAPAPGLIPPDPQRLVHELQVHQIELEMQNESLREMQAETSAALQRYAELNDQLEDIVTMRTAELVTARQIAEDASRAKSVFLANMSHELRTPMNAIMGLTGLALRRAEDPKLRDQLGKIEQASRHLLNLINDILDISRIEAERLTLEQVEFRFGTVLKNVSGLIQHKAGEKNLRLLIQLSPAVATLSLRGDPLRLGQVLLNLAANAVKFTDTGSITLRIALAEDGGDTVLLRCEVEDTGIGIAGADQSRIFTAFEQADGSMTRKYGGSGLGLAISKRLVKLMGGEIGLVSAPGKGSTFWFTVRLGKVPTASATLAPGPADVAEAQLRAGFTGARILLAEDEPINQEVLRELLMATGLVVDLAVDGAIAVEMARDHAYALILMDMQMPNLNGTAAARQIRQLPGHAATPIVAITANAFDEDRRICLAAGMNDHIGKPVDPEVLFKTVLKWLASDLGARIPPGAGLSGVRDLDKFGR